MDRPLREKCETLTATERFAGKTILAAPLDWGLGHATRMVPLIRALSKNNRVVICTTPVTRQLLTYYFPDLLQESIPSYGIRYSSILPQWLKIGLGWPALLRAIANERRACAALVSKHKADLLISDNRYGFHDAGVQSILMTHQLQVMAPLPWFVNFIHTRWLRRFGEIWVPDFPGSENRLAGKLSSRRSHSEIHYIGPLSALAGFSHQAVPSDFLLLLSGPEPQRTLLENALVARLRAATDARVVLVRGGCTTTLETPPHWRVVELAAGSELAGLIAGARTVVCRSGYSTLMDLHFFRPPRMVLVPTPGQPEQEYLARYWRDRFGAELVLQKDVGRWQP